MTEAEVFASCLALSHCHFLDTPYEGDPFSDELNSGASNVCHYCTIDTLLSIIEKQCLRFTDVRFLNDSTEFLEIIPLIEHVLTNGNYSSSFKQFFLQPSIIEDLKSYRQSYSAISNVDQTYKDMPYRTYTCSLSKNCDSLNMWNYYATSSAGVNIGFDFAWNMFEGSNSYKTNTGKRLSGDIWLSRGLVIYNNFDKEKCVIKFLDHLFNVYSNGFQETTLAMHKWLLYPILTSSVEELSKGLTYRSIRLKITSVHPQGKNLNPGNITQALKAVSSLQLSKSIQPIILDYDESNLTLHIVDKGFLIWLSMQDRNELLSTVGLPEMT